MMKSICKQFLFKNSPISIANKTLRWFSTKSLPLKDKVEDWQYVQHIMREIKDNDVNEALSYLIQSHLNGQILNKQIYYSLHEKMLESQMATGYHEVLYKLYREHFRPNQMTLAWMKKISKTQNSKLAEMLKIDFEKLNLEFPAKVQNKEEKMQHQNQSEKQSSVEQQSKQQSVGRKSRKVPTVISTDQYFSNTPETILVKRIQTEDVKMPNSQMKPDKKENIETQIASKFQEIMREMFKEYGKVTFHNVELQIDFDEDDEGSMEDEMNEMYNENDMHQEQIDEEEMHEEPTMDDFMMETISAIKKIKIGKVEFENSKTLETIKDLKNDLSLDPKTKE